jgi:sec-independent protein translocase protein TatA
MQLLGVIGGPEIIVILLIVLVLFGGKKIPELMKGLGKGVKEYKKAMNGVEEEINNITEDTPKEEPQAHVQ